MNTQSKQAYVATEATDIHGNTAIVLGTVCNTTRPQGSKGHMYIENGKLITATVIHLPE